MKGMIFTGFSTMVTETWSEDLLDELFEDAGLSGAYTTVGTYDHGELLALVGALSARTEIPPEELVRRFGHYLLGMLRGAHPEFFARAADLPAFLASIEGHVHMEVRKLYPEADPPRITVTDAQDGLDLEYRSHRPFAALALGLIEGAVEMFPGAWSIASEPLADGATLFRVRPL